MEETGAGAPLKLLVAYDGSPAATRAVELVAAYHGSAPTHALLLHAHEGATEDPGVMAAAESRLELAGIDVQVLDVPAAAKPAEAVLAESADRGIDAIVMGTRGSGVLHGFAFGSVAMRVAHGAAVPVLLVKPEDRLPAALGERLRVLLAMDGSRPALRAAQRLVDWRGWLGELDVQMVYAQPPLSTLETVLPPHDDVIGQWSTQEGGQATRAARELFEQAGIAHHVHLTLGDAPLEIRTLAEQTGADLVVLGTRGLGVAHHALIGSVALKAAALCGVPALLVP